MRPPQCGVLIAAAFLMFMAAGTASAQSTAQPKPLAVQLGGRYVADGIDVTEGHHRGQAFFVAGAELNADFNLDRLIGTHGTTASLYLLATNGGEPNHAAGTLQGVDNIEVSRHRVKLYEAWIEQAFARGRGSLRLGLTDLNADFYQNDSAGMLVAPAFGIGSELAATGPNGPSIFPSTALTARLSMQVGARGYARAAAVNAKAGVIGDIGGVDFSLRDGALVIAEAGVAGSGKLALGVWRYTQRQPDIALRDAQGLPVKHVAEGAYLLADHRIAGGDARGINLFARVGGSDGQTTPFHGGFQAGMLVRGPFAARPHGQFSLGVHEGSLSNGFRRNVRMTGAAPSPAEFGVEATYSDRLSPAITVQPDLQYVRRAYGTNGRNAVVLGLRLTLTGHHPAG
jgi:porin